MSSKDSLECQPADEKTVRGERCLDFEFQGNYGCQNKPFGMTGILWKAITVFCVFFHHYFMWLLHYVL